MTLIDASAPAKQSHNPAPTGSRVGAHSPNDET